jgi:hypothetical protein
MANLTLSNEVIKEHSPEPLEGHVVVVVERVGDSGERVYSDIHPKDPPLRSGFLETVLGGTSKYIGFAVTSARGLRYSFGDHVRLDDQLHEIDLAFDLTYQVAEPRTVVTHRLKDPLGTVVDSIKAVIGREVEQLRWDFLRKQFREAEQTVVSRTRDRLLRHASEYGIAILELALRLRVREVDLEVERAHQSEAREKEARRIEHAKQLESIRFAKEKREYELKAEEALADIELGAQEKRLRREGRKTLAEGSMKAFNQVVANTTTVSELVEGFRITRQLATEGLGQSSGGRIAAPDQRAGLLSSAGPPTTTRVETAMSQIDALGCGHAQKQTLRVAVLRYFADVIDEAGTDEARTHASDAVLKLVSELQPAPSPDDMRFFRELSKAQQLRNQLI